MSDAAFQIFVSCAPGFESLLAQECNQLSIRPLQIEGNETMDSRISAEDVGGILIEGGLEEVLRANLHLRTASRVSVRLGSFYAAAFSELRKKASRLAWDQFITAGQGVNIHVTCHKSRLYHSDAVAERVLGAINDHFSAGRSVASACHMEKNGQLILVRLVHDLCTISVDSSGAPLYKRGYRQEVSKAPLRETLAAAMLLASGWDRISPLIDPFCGSGTIPIEAALLAGNIPPGIARNFAFTQWSVFKPDLWVSLLHHARQSILQPQLEIYGFDRDSGAIRMAVANASRAGQKERIQFHQQSISELRPTPSPGWILTNPPYGVRLRENKDLRDLYARFGNLLSDHFQGWQAGILCNDPQLIGNLGLQKPVATERWINGGVPVKFLRYSL